MRRAGFTLGSVLLCLGCSRGSEAFHVVAAPTALPVASAAVAVPALKPCDVRMFIEQRPGAGPEGISQGRLGAIIAESVNEKQLVNGVCIKRPGERLELPASMLIAAVDASPQLTRFCRADEADYTVVDPGTGAAVAVKACTWNGVFHSARPFTVTLLTDPSHSVGDYVEFLRVYRNGDLMAAWNRVSDQITPFRVVIPGQSLTTGIFAVSHPPHLSEMDIRVIPRDDSVVQAVDTATRDDYARFKTTLKTALGAAVDVWLPPDTPERKSFDCLKSELKRDASKIMRVVSGQVALDPACDVLTGALTVPGTAVPPAPTPLSDAYAALKTQSRDELNALRTQAYLEIEQAKSQALASIPVSRAQFGKALAAGLKALPEPPRAACIAQFIDHVSGSGCTLAAATKVDPKLVELASAEFQKLQKLGEILDQDVQAVLGTADEARALADQLNDKAKELAASPAKQAQVFNAFAQSVAAQGDPFEPRRDNPPLLMGEQKIPLEYADRFQWFVVAPWNGVPLHVNQGGEADFNAAVAVPFLDVLGGRFQWAKSRFADARLAVGVGYVQTTSEKTGDKQAAALPNVSVGFGTMKIGLGMVAGKGLGSGSERVRLIVGADLYKLISGGNVEAL